MGDARGSSQDRSRERREQLLRAAVDLIAERGVRSVTHRAVSGRAGLPAPTAGYYFATVAQLIEEALASHVRMRVAELAELLDPALADATTLDDVGVRVAQALTVGASPRTLAQYEVYLEAARNPGLRAVVAESIAAFEAVASRRLAALGLQDPDRAAKAFLAMVDGFALHRLAFPQSIEEDSELLSDSLRGLFLSYPRLDP